MLGASLCQALRCQAVNPDSLGTQASYLHVNRGEKLRNEVTHPVAKAGREEVAFKSRTIQLL